MTEINSASQSRSVRESEGNFLLKSRCSKSRLSCDLCTAVGYFHEKCRRGCNGGKSESSDIVGAGNVSDNSSDFSAPRSAWELSKKHKKTRNPVALGILWGQAGSKNEECASGCKTDKGIELIVT